MSKQVLKFVPKVTRRHYDIADSDTTIETLEGTNPVYAGDYILTGEKGEQWAIPAKKFHEIYEDFGNGNCQKRIDINNPSYANHLNDMVEATEFKIGRNTFLATPRSYLIRKDNKSLDFYIMQEDIFDASTEIIEICNNEETSDFINAFVDALVSTMKEDLSGQE